MFDTNQYLSTNTILPQYFQFPLFLLEQAVGTTAKLVYMLLYDRARVSIQNGWQSGGRVYIVYPVEEVAKRVHRSVSSVKTAMDELEKCGLLERKPGGFGKPNQLFIKLPVRGPEIRLYDGQFSGSMTASFPAPNKVIESSNINQSKEVLPYGRYRKAGREKMNFYSKEIPFEEGTSL